MADPRAALPPAQCPVCRQQFPVTAKICPRHQVPLVPIDQPTDRGAAVKTILHDPSEVRTDLERRGLEVTPKETNAAQGPDRTVLEPAFQPRHDPDPPTLPAAMAAPPAAVLPTAPATSVLGQTFDGYLTTQLLAEGGMGVVYEAQHPLLGTQAVVKVLKKSLRNDPIAKRRMVTEGQTLSALVHRNVVRVIGFGHLADGRPWLMMERLVGESLHTYLKGHGPLPVDEALALMTQIAAGLEATHALGVVHRDLKPDNIFVTVESDGERLVKLIDFGIARPEDSGEPPEPSDFKTMMGRFVGTLAYGAPEVFMGAPCSAASDVYALGCVFFEMLTGRRPFSGATPLETVRQAVEGDAPRLRSLNPQVPLPLDELIDAMLSKHPGERPSLEVIRAALRPAAPSVTALPTVVRSRTPTWVWLLVIAFLGVSGALAWKLLRG